jgi:hypothetical protein
LADQNFRVKRGLEVGIGGTVLTATAVGNIGIGSTNPTSKLTVSGDGNFSGVVTATSFSGSGSNLTDIVTSIVAGTNVTISGSTGQVTINASVTGGGGGESYWVQTSAGIHTLSNVGIGTTNPTSRLTVSGDARVSGVITAMTFSGQVNAGVSTLGITTTAGLSATQLSISGVSTFAGITTVTGTTLFSRQLNVSGITTLGITRTAGLSATQLSVSGVSTFAGITTVTGTTLFSRQLNVSGVSTFNNTLNVVPTSTGIAGLFSGTTSSDMVRITQLGTGNALVVEDSTNPDSTPFVISGGGNVGIGTTNPFGGVIGNNGLDVNLSSAIIFARNKDTTGESSVWSVDNDWFSTPSYKGVGIRNFGTSTAGNVLGSIPFASGGALAFQNTSYGLIYTNGGSPLIFGTLATEALRIDTSQRVGIKTTNPSFDVDISGDARIQSTNKMRFGGTSGTTNFYIQYNSTTNSLDFVAG